MSDSQEDTSKTHYICQTYVEKKGTRGAQAGLKIDKQFQHSTEAQAKFGYSEIYIESLPEFSKAIDMYQKQGFIQLKSPMGVSGHTSCNIWMLKSLINDKD